MFSPLSLFFVCLIIPLKEELLPFNRRLFWRWGCCGLIRDFRCATSLGGKPKDGRIVGRVRVGLRRWLASMWTGCWIMGIIRHVYLSIDLFLKFLFWRHIEDAPNGPSANHTSNQQMFSSLILAVLHSTTTIFN